MAIEVTTDEIRLDGRLDEEVWRRTTPVSDFVQKEPNEGESPTERTEVWFAYSDRALYVAARMYSSGGQAAIQAPLGRRDERDQTEFILISLDTFRDLRTAYSFGVTAGGVRIDHFHRSDSENDIDSGWDPVWEGYVTVDEEGWSAEMWIPFSQLRFSSLTEQVWGLNVRRWIPSKNEELYWVAIPRTQDGWASRFGVLEGITRSSSTRRAEIVPFVMGSSTLNGARDHANPFDDGRNLEARTGADLKVGVGPNLTLDATFRPDFGQVEVDPAVVNLTAYETFFDERRPFFTEGIRLIGGNIPNYFYSRRIGARPIGPASADYVDYPQYASILGAAKLTGRFSSGTSIGLLGALTGNEHARTFSVMHDSIGNILVAPLSTYGVARVQQEFGATGSASLLVTGLHRDLASPELASLLTRNAFAVASETVWRLGNNAYEFGISGGVSHVEGDEAAILGIQRASARYFQRPDVTHVRVDSTRTSLTGFKATFEGRKISGTHWLWDAYLDFESPGAEFNDVGRLTAGDGVMTRGSLTYRETSPGRLYRSYRLTLGQNSEWTFGGDRQWTRVNGSGSLVMNNFWALAASTEVSTRGQDWRLTRGGPSMGTPFGWTSSLSLSNSTSSTTRWSLSAQLADDEAGGWRRRFDASLSFVPAPRWRIALSPSHERQVDPRQYVMARGGGPEETFGGRYIFASIDRTTLAIQGRLNFTLRPDVNLDFFAQPFAASGRYFDFGELPEARSPELRKYGTDGSTIARRDDGSFEVQDGADSFVLSNRDFNVRSFRSTAVLRWEWRPGSTLYLVWQQDRSRNIVSDAVVTAGDMLGSLGAPGNNYLAIKASYWLGL